QVSKTKGEQLAVEYGIKFMETSAKASINVEEAFFALARDIKGKMDKKLEDANRTTGSVKVTNQTKQQKKGWSCTLL
uniref:hypothetical protein n=1 Tax=Salmonella sp. s54412 TaxID=3160128 RepID=UPI00375533A5